MVNCRQWPYTPISSFFTLCLLLLANKLILWWIFNNGEQTFDIYCASLISILYWVSNKLCTLDFSLFLYNLIGYAGFKISMVIHAVYRNGLLLEIRSFGLVLSPLFACFLILYSTAQCVQRHSIPDPCSIQRACVTGCILKNSPWFFRMLQKTQPYKMRDIARACWVFVGGCLGSVPSRLYRL